VDVGLESGADPFAQILQHPHERLVLAELDSETSAIVECIRDIDTMGECCD
jgi:hypothetical protein